LVLITYLTIGLADKAIQDILTKKKYAERVKYVLDEAKIDSCDKEVGHAICQIAEKISTTYNHRIPLILKYVLDKRLLNPSQIDAVVELVKEKGDLPLTEEEFEKRIGVRYFI
jgi:hypothetical protein